MFFRPDKYNHAPDTTYIDVRDVSLAFAPGGNIVIFPLPVADEPLVSMQFSPTYEELDRVEVNQEMPEYAYVYFADSDDYLQVKHTEEGLIFDLWSGDDVLWTSAVEWADIEYSADDYE